MSSCPQGSPKERDYTGLVFCLLIDLLLFVAVAFAGIKKWLAKAESLDVGPIRTNEDNIGVLGGLKQTMTNAMVSPKANLPSNEKRSTFEDRDIINAFKSSMNGSLLRIHLKFNNMSLTLPSGATILDNVTGEIQPGRFTAILGPSGCGSIIITNLQKQPFLMFCSAK
jgi:ABC-type multidrug transport system fused ATPase/permease subunit